MKIESSQKFIKNEFYDPKSILKNCTVLNPLDEAYLNHPIIGRFGSPSHPIYVDHSNVNIEGVIYEQPLILPIVNGQLDPIQCAVVQNEQRIQIIPDGLAHGFAYFGDLQIDKPIIITHNLEVFFKIVQTGYAVVLVVLPTLSSKHLSELKAFDFEQIQFVSKQLSNAGYKQLYMPVRPEQIQLEAFQNLEKNTPVRLLNQYQKSYEVEFFMELCKEDDIEEVQAFISESIAHLPKQKQWGNLLPLVQADTIANRPYPIHALPPLARDAAMAITEYVQAPIAMSAQCVIGAMSHIAQAHVNAPHPINAQGEPCSLYLLTEGQSGSRKSTSRNMADKAIIQYERKQYEQYRRDLEQWKSGQASLNKKDREAYCAENPSPHDPSTLYSDITLESITGLYVDGILNNASIASDEAGQFFGGYTMKGDTRTQAIGGYAKLFDDGFVERTRSKSNLNGSGRAYDVRLTFNLQGQHEVLADALKDPVLRGQGFLARFILTIPENLAGTRLQDVNYQNKNANMDHRLIAYWKRCEYLLDDCPRPHADKELHNGRYLIPMNEQAKKIDLVFYNKIEELQVKGKRYEYLQPFASRASQLARRLATIFAYFQGLQRIDATTLKGACEIVLHSLNEWARYADIEVKAESNAEKLIKWFAKYCAKKKIDKLTYSSFMNSCPRPMRGSKQKLEPILDELIDSHYLKIEEISKVRYVLINPILLEIVA